MKIIFSDWERMDQINSKSNALHKLLYDRLEWVLSGKLLLADFNNKLHTVAGGAPEYNADLKKIEREFMSIADQVKDHFDGINSIVDDYNIEDEGND